MTAAPEASPPASASAGAVARPLALGVVGITAAVALVFDIITKELALSNLENVRVVRLLGGALYLDVTRNPGAAFSIGVDYTFVFPIIAVVVLGAIGFLLRRLRSVAWALSLGLIVGGVLGNLADRLFRAPAPMHGHVVDFISVFAEGGRVFPIFNIADSVLFCGVVIAIALEFTGRRRDGGREPGRRRRVSDGSVEGGDADDANARGTRAVGTRDGMVRYSDREGA